MCSVEVPCIRIQVSYVYGWRKFFLSEFACSNHEPLYSSVYIVYTTYQFDITYVQDYLKSKGLPSYKKEINEHTYSCIDIPVEGKTLQDFPRSVKMT